MAGTALTVTPVPGALGARVDGVDLRQPLDDAQVAAIRQALQAHRVVFLHGAVLDPAQLAAFGARFGELEDYPFVAPVPGHPKVIPVVKEADETVNFGGGWHTDLIYRHRPPMGTVLHALEVPRRGGDTLFADGVLAFRALSARMQDLLRTLDVEYNVRHIARAMTDRGGGAGPANRSMPGRSDSEVLAETPCHPLVRRHPETGDETLYFSREHTVRFAGMGEGESRPLLDWLAQHMTQPVFTTRFHWQPGATAFWDNRCVSHCALNDYPGERRAMQRLTIAGEVPVAAARRG